MGGLAWRPRIALGALVFGIVVCLAGCGGSGGGTVSPTTGAIEGYVFARTRAATPPASNAPPSQEPGRQAEPPPGTAALLGATVRVEPTGAQATTATDRSGRGGFFRVADLAPGAYTVTVSRTGFHSATFVANVLAGETTLAGTNDGQTILEPTGPSPRRKWTFMVYMDGDNDLEEFGVLNLNEMEMVGSDANVNIVVQFDRSPIFDATNGDWTGARRFLVLKDSDTRNITSPVIENLGRMDSADPVAMQQFITWAVTNFPADHYVMVPWNHGSGWRARALPGQSRGIIFDDTSNTFMTMDEFNRGLNVPAVLPNGFDLIAMDASLMGMVEVCYEIRNRAPLIAASEESPPGEGYPYQPILAALVANPDMTPEALGRVFVAQHVARYPTRPVTQSLIRTASLPAFVRKVDEFAGALLAVLPQRNAEFRQARLETQSYFSSYYRDLFDFASNAQLRIPDASVNAAAEAVRTGLLAENGGPVIVEAHTTTSMADSHGLSIYLPADGEFFSGYADLAFTRPGAAPQWNQLVRTVTNQP